jgi:hypothetical protein
MGIEDQILLITTGLCHPSDVLQPESNKRITETDKLNCHRSRTEICLPWRLHLVLELLVCLVYLQKPTTRLLLVSVKMKISRIIQ